MASGTMGQGLPKLWTAAEAAAYLAVSAGTVRTLAEGGKLPCCKIGQQKRFDPESLRRWVRERKFASDVVI